MSKNANYRKHNDRTHNSSTYHKKDGTPVRHTLKTEAKEEIAEEMSEIKRRRELDPSEYNYCSECRSSEQYEAKLEAENKRLRGLLREVLSAPYCAAYEVVIVPDEVMLKIKEEVRDE